ncbi:MAG TPA: hypothetical protein VGK22_17190 [Candidatus Angelobacter sp.]|jgi:hypothetical protein
MPDWINVCIDWFSLPSLVFLAAVILYRRQYKEFPLFFWYVIVTELVGLIRLVASRAPNVVYAYTYWISDIILVFFAFLATYELFIKRLFPAFYKVRFFRYLFPSAAIIVNIVVIVVALYANHSRILLLTARMYEFLRAAILFFFVALMIVMGREWRKVEFGIAFGLGLDVSTSLATVAFFSHAQERSQMLNRLPVIAYDIACIVWIYCFWTVNVSTGSSPPVSPEILQKAKKWEGSLKDFIAPGKR